MKQQLNLETGEITRPKMLENDAFAIFWLWNHWMSEWVNEWVSEWVSEWMNEWKASKSVFGLMTLTFDFRTPIIDNFIFFRGPLVLIGIKSVSLFSKIVFRSLVTGEWTTHEHTDSACQSGRAEA